MMSLLIKEFSVFLVYLKALALEYFVFWYFVLWLCCPESAKHGYHTKFQGFKYTNRSNRILNDQRKLFFKKKFWTKGNYRFTNF